MILKIAGPVKEKKKNHTGLKAMALGAGTTGVLGGAAVFGENMRHKFQDDALNNLRRIEESKRGMYPYPGLEIPRIHAINRKSRMIDSKAIRRIQKRDLPLAALAGLGVGGAYYAKKKHDMKKQAINMAKPLSKIRSMSTSMGGALNKTNHITASQFPKINTSLKGPRMGGSIPSMNNSLAPLKKLSPKAPASLS